MIKQKLIELLEAIKNKWFCSHQWKLFREIEVEGSFGEIFHKYIFYCTKCGKFKKIKTNF